MSSLNLEQKAKHAVAAAITARDAARNPGSSRLGLLFVGSALLHVVAVIALLHSWGSGSPPAVKRVAPIAQQVVDEVQVVRLELAVAPASESEIVKLASAASSVPEESKSEESESADDESGSDGELESLELKPAVGTEPDADTDEKEKTNKLRRGARVSIS